MSFDGYRLGQVVRLADVSIPFEQGDVFRPKLNEMVGRILQGLNPFRAGRCLSTDQLTMLNGIMSQSLSSRAMSFDLNANIVLTPSFSLNPFRAGRCLSTQQSILKSLEMTLVSIPFEQGDVFRLQRYAGGRNHAAFQTHFPIFLEG